MITNLQRSIKLLTLLAQEKSVLELVLILIKATSDVNIRVPSLNLHLQHTLGVPGFEG